MHYVKRFSGFKEFVEFNEEFIDSNPMLYFFLNETIERVLRGEEKVHTFFNIISDDQVHVSVLLTTVVCLIYDNHYDEAVLKTISDKLEYHKFNRYQFAGSKQTIEGIFKMHNSNYSIQKHRVIYQCREITDNFAYAEGKLQMGDINKLDVLAKLSAGFLKEYYGESKNLQQVRYTIAAGIQEDSIYQWFNRGKICSIAQSLNNDYNFPVIGNFYTDPDERNKGYGASIIHGLTKGLLGQGHQFVMLSTNALTPSSNRVFEKVGYCNVGEYLLAHKEKDD